MIKISYIVNNIHVVNDLIKRIQDNEEAAALIFMYQEKTFDGADYDFLMKTLKALGFSSNFTELIKILYKNMENVIKLNGFFPTMIEIERGLIQLCPINALLLKY